MSQVLNLSSGGGGGAGTVTSISAGTGITLTPDPIIATGTIALTIPVAIANGGTNAISFATTDGVVYYSGSSLLTTSAGSAGNILVSNGAGNAPSYVAVGLVLVSTKSATGVTTIDFTSIGAYTNYILIVEDLGIPSASSTIIIALMSDDNGSTWKVTGYDSGVNSNLVSSNSPTNTNSTAQFNLSTRQGAVGTTNQNGSVYFFGMNISGNPSYIGRFSAKTLAMGILYNNISYGSYTTAPITANAIRISNSAGNTFTSGNISLYGLVQ